LTDGIRNNYFFNGRLLSAEDLREEQVANSEARRRLGLAIGEGVASGLYVSEAGDGISTRSAPVVTVTSGLAINRRGSMLVLNEATDVSLVRPTPPGAIPTASTTFKDCEPLQSSVYVAGEGVYLLTIGPSSGKEGRAPVSGLSNSNGTCNSHYTIEGVQFRLIQLDFTAAELSARALLRNLVAYKCFGVTDLQKFVTNPFGPLIKEYGLLDGLRSTRLTDCEVPLAVLYWTAARGINFIDMWSVRRRLIDPATNAAWRIVTGERRLAEAEAMLLQFEDELKGLRFSGGAPQTIIAREHFKYVPPVGIIPIHRGGAPAGFDYEQFFQNVTYREPVFIEGAKVEPLFRNSLSCKPIDLTSGEAIWLYKVRENRQTIDGGGTNLPQPYMIFASGYVPFIGDAQFDLSRWDYSNYSKFE
jgi:hypothetical protein